MDKWTVKINSLPLFYLSQVELSPFECIAAISLKALGPKLAAAGSRPWKNMQNAANSSREEILGDTQNR